MLDNAFEALKSYDWGTDAKALKPIDDAIIASHGDGDARLKLEARILAALKTDLSYDAKNMLCRKLRTIGSAASVPALAELLTDEKLSHTSRYALERIPADEAGAALRDALPKVKNAQQIGVMSSLGVRQDNAAVAAIGKLVSSDDAAVALAAARALGAIRTADAAKALTSAKPNDAAKAAAIDSTLACAETLLSDGKKAEALALYKGLLPAAKAKHAKLAVTRGMLACAKK